MVSWQLTRGSSWRVNRAVVASQCEPLRQVPLATGGGKVSAALADPQRRRRLARLLGALLEALAQEGWIAGPEWRDQGAFVEVGPVDDVRRVEVDDDGIQGQQEDALDEEKVVRIHRPDRLDRVLEHRPQI